MDLAYLVFISLAIVIVNTAIWVALARKPHPHNSNLVYFGLFK